MTEDSTPYTPTLNEARDYLEAEEAEVDERSEMILNPQPRVRVERTKIATADLEILLAAARSIHAIDEGIQESMRSLDPEDHARLGEILSAYWE